MACAAVPDGFPCPEYTTPESLIPARPTRIVYASPSGLAVAKYDCSVRQGLAGAAWPLHREPHSTVHSMELFRSTTNNGSSSWSYRVQGAVGRPARGTCIPFDPHVERRLEEACSDGGESWPLCLIGSDSVADEQLWASPSRHVHRNATCVLQRHRRFFGDLFLPGTGQAPPSMWPPPAGPAGAGDGLGSESTGSALAALREPIVWERLGQQTQSVDEVVGCAPAATFLADYLKRGRPLVMRGCARGTPAAGRWSDAYLSRAAGKWTRPAAVMNSSRDVHAAGSTVGDGTLADFLQYYRTPGVSDAFERQQPPPSLLRDIELPESVDCALVRAHLEGVMFWLSHGGKRSPLHFDNLDGLLIQLDGHKTLTLVDPIDSLFIYGDFSHHYGLSPLTGVDLASQTVELARFPAAARATLMHVSLSPGDVLLLPARAWHMVETPAHARNLAVTLQLTPMASMMSADGCSAESRRAGGERCRSYWSYAHALLLSEQREAAEAANEAANEGGGTGGSASGGVRLRLASEMGCECALDDDTTAGDASARASRVAVRSVLDVMVPDRLPDRSSHAEILRREAREPSMLWRAWRRASLDERRQCGACVVHSQSELHR